MIKVVVLLDFRFNFEIVEGTYDLNNFTEIQEALK